jgi:hypothetical protein
MGLLDDAKGRLGNAAEWVKDKTGHLGEHTQGAGQTLGAKAAEARKWVEGRIGGEGSGEGGAGHHGLAEPGAEDAAAGDGDRLGGGGDFTSEWVDASADPAMGAPQAGESPAADEATLDEPGPQNPL